MIYIQRKDRNFLETVGEYTNRREALKDLAEYRLSDRQGFYYLSQRACKDW